MHFYLPALLLYCDTNIRYCQMPAFENALGNSHLIIFAELWPLWSGHFRTLIDRFNSFLETEGHSDHRKPMWTQIWDFPVNQLACIFNKMERSLAMRIAQLRIIGWFVTSVCAQWIVTSMPSESAAHRFSTTSWTPVMGVWTAQSQCKMDQAALVWPQRWSNTVSDQTAAKGIPKLEENRQTSRKIHAPVTIQQRRIKWPTKSENIIYVEEWKRSSDISRLLTAKRSMSDAFQLWLKYHHHFYSRCSNQSIQRIGFHDIVEKNWLYLSNK